MWQCVAMWWHRCGVPLPAPRPTASSPNSRAHLFLCCSVFLFGCLGLATATVVDGLDKETLRLQAKEMFMHGYNSYMKYAFPHDELMPLSCRGRERGVTPSRGDVDDSLGNFSLTLVDTLDTLVVIGELDEFERAVALVVATVRFDSDLVVSVFETNIRMVGGLLSAHIFAKLLQSQDESRLGWYSDELLKMAADLADRLLPAFNTTSGLPFSRINLRYGMQNYLTEQRETCTACGGTMILEFAALSRLTGRPVYEEKARRAMDFLWEQRHRGSDLMGTVLNVHSGDWVRRDAGIGAGIDSYYEYCLKAYILLGDDDYLHRFNKHYEAIMRYVNKGPLFIDVHMHKPTVASRSFMDALLAFWPGLQVLKGDLKSAIEFHETLYQVIKRHRFLPEAFTHDLQIHWAQYPLRPEFIESTYLLYRATKDPHYLRVAKNVMDSLNELVRVDCGFAGVKDIRTMSHEDRMDSFVLSETFKYLYMIFSEVSDMAIDPDNYVLTTEAHFLPLSIGDSGDTRDKLPRRLFIDPDELLDDAELGEGEKRYRSACPNIPQYESTLQLSTYARSLRTKVQNVMEELTKHSAADTSNTATCAQPSERLRAWAFSASNSEHIRQLNQMGIHMTVHTDGRLQLTHSSTGATSLEWANAGMEFMQEMMQLAAQFERQASIKADRYVQVLSQPWFGSIVYRAAPAQFGADVSHDHVEGEARWTIPRKACRPVTNGPSLKGRIALVERQECMFQEKARFAQQAGAIAVIIVDNLRGTSADTSPPFAMSGENGVQDDIRIPVVFLFHEEGSSLSRIVERLPDTIVHVSVRVVNPAYLIENFFLFGDYAQIQKTDVAPELIEALDNSGLVMVVDSSLPAVLFNFRFGDVDSNSPPSSKHKVVEENIARIGVMYSLNSVGNSNTQLFMNTVRRLAYGLLGLGTALNEADIANLLRMVPSVQLADLSAIIAPGPATSLACQFVNTLPRCHRVFL